MACIITISNKAQCVVNVLKKFSRKFSEKSIFLCVRRNVAEYHFNNLAAHLNFARHFTVMTDSDKKTCNRLALEKSPYLLQHSTNPVDWYPWGEEAFSKAIKENKLIFLSIGYSTCHWCHVMKRESFENERIAKIMNENFVCIKVDREERPDVDKFYMMFIQAITGQGGWPMSVWLQPDLTPVAGGTYYPPTDQNGRPGFPSLLLFLSKKWHENQQKFSESGQKVIDFIEKSCILDNSILNPLTAKPPDISCHEKCYNFLLKNYEEKYGGFSKAPKFPHLVNLNFLFHVYSREPRSEKGKKALDMCLYTLKMLANGGIHDHIGQGFSRYSVDEKWHVPHFEKMLYDQGQLAVSYASAYLITKNEFFADILKDILTYVNRDLSHPDGGFYSAEDADSLPTPNATEKKEGAFYVWTNEEIRDLLKQKISELPELTYADVFCTHFGVLPEGNVDSSKDPHGEFMNKNVLWVVEDEDTTAQKLHLSKERTHQILGECKKILFEFRSKRSRPQLDNKFLTAWNGLMISGFAKAGQALGNSNYIQRATGAAKFVRQYLFRSDTKTLLRSCYRGSDGIIGQIANPINGFLNDYAFLIRGLLDLYEASFDPTWIEWAELLQESQDKLFWDEGGAGYYSSPSGDSSILVRMKEDHDGAEPSGNSVSAQNLLRLEAYLCKHEYSEKVEKLLGAFTSRLNKSPILLPEMITALLFYYDGPTQILITGKCDDPDTAALLNVVHSRFIPNRILALVDGDKNSILHKKNDIFRSIKCVQGQSAAYVCHHHTCSLPVNTREELSKLLDKVVNKNQPIEV